MIEFRGIHKRFGKVEVLRDLDLSVSSQGITAILGPNGSGKTTLIKTALGMVVPDRGTVLLDGRPVNGEWRYREGINYLPQIASFPNNLSAAELIEMVKDLRGKPQHEDALIQLFALAPFLDKKLNTLSGGTKQKINLALALMNESSLMILDEPTAGLDPVSLVHFKKLIAEERARGKTIVLTTHIMSLVAELADEIVFLLDGTIRFQGTLEAIFAQTQEQDLERAIAVLLGGGRQ